MTHMFTVTGNPAEAMVFDSLGDAASASTLIDRDLPDCGEVAVEPVPSGWRVVFESPLGQTVWLSLGPTVH